MRTRKPREHGVERVFGTCDRFRKSKDASSSAKKWAYSCSERLRRERVGKAS